MMDMLRLKNITFLFFLLTFTNSAFSQQTGSVFQLNQSIKFKSITIQDGLSQNWVRCIYQDDQGFMWFGASGGLNRYDGYEIKFYSLGNVNVNAITKKSDYELWICNDLGVFIYDQKKDTISSFHYLKGQTVLDITQEGDNTVWFGTNTGLYRYTPSDDKLYGYFSEDKSDSGLSNNYVNTLFQDSDNNLWIGTKTGLNRYVRSTDSFVKYLTSAKAGSLSGNDVMAICEDHDKRIWVGTAKDGVNLMLADKNNIQFRKIAGGAAISLLVDRNNKLWIGTSSNGGVLQIDLDHFSVDKPPDIIQFRKNRIDPGSLSDNSIFCIYEDRLHDIWIGTFGGGVNYFSYRSKKFFTVKEGIDDMPALKNDLVNAIWEEDRYLWLGTEGGLDRFDKFNRTTKHFTYESNTISSLSSDPVYALNKDSRGNFWVGTWTGGLNLYNSRTETFKRFVPDQKPGSMSSENVFAIYEDSRNNLWIGTVGGGLNRYDYRTEIFTTYRHDPQNPKSLYFDVVHDIEETPDGRLLIAASGSLDIYNYASDNFTHYPLNSINPDKISSRFIIVIFKDSRNNIWLGTNEGLLLFNEDEKESHIHTTQDGLAGNTVQGILEDTHGNLWISTNNGLSKFVHAVEHPGSPEFINFNESDGLSGSEFKSRAVFKNKSGQMYLGTSQGFSYFHPDSIFLNPTPPEVVFVEMQLLQFQSGNNSEENLLVQNINSIEKVELSYSKSDFVITFAALNYLNPQNNKYKYMLGGYDPDWVPAGNHRTATYKNLQPGKYTFMVLGSNNDEIWSKDPKTLQITIHPPFWQTWWFRVIMILIVLSTVFLVFSWRVKAIQKEKRKLEKLVEERTTELSDANVRLEEQSEELINQNEELRQNQEQLSLYKDQLEELVVKRTSELEKAKTKAEESDRLKSTFLANMSHEIRTPLNAITGFAGLFDDPDIDAETRKTYYSIIQANSHTLLRLIDDILDLSTIQANQIIMKFTQFAPIKVFREVYLQFLPEATGSVAFHLKTDEDAESAVIYADEYRFRQIITNLISNAFKFTENGSIEIGFHLYSRDQMVFYVKDSGIGISEEEQKIIFNHFTKVEKETRIFRGVGLGLAICKQLAELMGGKIWIESAPDKGSTFFFTQPISKSET
jgi:signal transduction histidine kinase/ligand-binding sensor domain-containing protein